MAELRGLLLAENMRWSFEAIGIGTSRRNSTRGCFQWDAGPGLPAILKYSRVPASVLVEVGNVKNSYDREFLATATGRKRIAEAIGIGVLIDAKMISLESQRDFSLKDAVGPILPIKVFCN